MSDALSQHPAATSARATTRPAGAGSRCRPSSAIPLLLAGAALGLTACGGSGGTSTNAAAQPQGQGYGTGTARSDGASAAAREKLQACLKQEGVTLPMPPAGARGGQGAGAGGQGAPPTRTDGQGAPSTGTGGRPPAGGLPGGGGGRGGFGANLSSAERKKLQAAMKKCGGGAGGPAGRRGGQGGSARPDVGDPAYRKRITAYVACVRKNGFDLPDPDFSGKGPIFDPKKVDQTDATFLKASKACQGELRAQG